MAQDNMAINSSLGANLQTKFMDQGMNDLPNPESPVANSLPKNPLYNALQVLFQGKQTDNISGYNANDLFASRTTGLKANFTETLTEKPKFMSIG
ncbi:hypothetical protein IJ541_02345 [bacterium]|nr:hypothetical protein [bacterium]